jgi:hypothetical protein
VSRHGSWGADRWTGYPRERDELLDFIRAERVTVLGADIHAAIDIDLGAASCAWRAERVTRRRSWLALLIGAAIVAAVVLAPIVFDLSPQ